MTPEKEKEYLEFVKSLQQQRACCDVGTKDMFTPDCSFLLLHSSMGMVTEAAEVMDIIKKHAVYSRPIDLNKLKDELGDLLHYLVMALINCGSSLNEIVDINVAKLKTRYPNGYNHQSANNRDVKAETEAQLGLGHKDI